MQLFQARVYGQPREVNTKFGQKSVLDVCTVKGDMHTIWRPAGDREVLGRVDGERISIAVDSKGKASLIETVSTGLSDPFEPTTKPMGFTVDLPFEAEQKLRAQMAVIPAPIEDGSRSAEIASYVAKLGKLYGHCLSTAANMPKTIELEAPEVKDVATTLFIQAVKHFSI